MLSGMLEIIFKGGRLKSLTVTLIRETKSHEDEVQDDDELGLLGRIPDGHRLYPDSSRRNERKRGPGGNQWSAGEPPRQFGLLVDAAERA
jgi:hypothetical protein